MPWYMMTRPYEEPGWQGQDSATVIDGVEHIFGCMRDSRCFERVGGRLVLGCDCTCHNGESLGKRRVGSA